MVDAEQFRAVLGQFATGVTVVTLPADPSHGITVSAFASLSIDPPLVLVSLDHDTDAHRRLADGDDDGFAVNILSRQQRESGEFFAGMTDEGDPLAEATDAPATGAPIFDDDLAYVDCSLYDSFEAGDHTVYVGRVEAAELLNPDGEPLTYHRGEWGTIASSSDDS
ncbi:flavin reductase family protein [Halorhabdus amylolytica]|uniref:flavin reductase family protein n=1 Tax=Halorhabdus amylolytica TaxID=2559573 RepID=UPI0010AAF9A6|nr:flavin reductase family protein [Halorhabdus amylolytica]